MGKFKVTCVVPVDGDALIDDFKAVGSFYTDELPTVGDTIYLNGFYDVLRRIRFDYNPNPDGAIPVALIVEIQTDIADELDIIKKIVF